jgi:hypothetical protein
VWNVCVVSVEVCMVCLYACICVCGCVLLCVVWCVWALLTVCSFIGHNGQMASLISKEVCTILLKQLSPSNFQNKH